MVRILFWPNKSEKVRLYPELKPSWPSLQILSLLAELQGFTKRMDYLIEIELYIQDKLPRPFNQDQNYEHRSLHHNPIIY